MERRNFLTNAIKLGAGATIMPISITSDLPEMDTPITEQGLEGLGWKIKYFTERRHGGYLCKAEKGEFIMYYGLSKKGKMEEYQLSLVRHGKLGAAFCLYCSVPITYSALEKLKSLIEPTF